MKRVTGFYLNKGIIWELLEDETGKTSKRKLGSKQKKGGANDVLRLKNAKR